MMRHSQFLVSLVVVVLVTIFAQVPANAAVPPIPGVQPLPAVNELKLTSLKTWFTTPPVFAEQILDTRLVGGSLSTPADPVDPPPYKPFTKPRIKVARSGALEIKIGAPILDANLTLETPGKRVKGKPTKPKTLYRTNGLHFGTWPSGGTVNVRFRLPGWKKLRQARTLRVRVQFDGGLGTYRYGVLPKDLKLERRGQS